MEETEYPPIDIENLYLTATSRLPPLSSGCCIYKVPNRLRKVNERAYTPQVVSIGPLHSGNEALKAMEEHKWRYLQHFIEITDLTIRDFVEIVKKNENRIRACYANSFAYPSNYFVALILLDAVFIIEILLRFCSKEFDDENDRIYYKPWIIQHIVPDLQLLENQIPFFIIEEIYELGKTAGSPPRSLQELYINELCHKFFKYNIGFVEADELKATGSPKILHFVDLGRKLYIPDEELPMQAEQTPRREIMTRAREVVGRLKEVGDRPISVRRFSLLSNGRDHKEGQSLQKLDVPTVTKLHHAGVKLKVGSPEQMFNIKFHDGVLEIPKLFITDHTEIFLRNIIAFEQCHCPKFTITNYFVVLKRLVNTPRDLELLMESKIIDHALGDSNQVLTLITKLADEVTVDYTDSDFVLLCKDMDDYCKVSWHKWMANLKQIYFDTPWTTLSVIAASIIIILTFIQTVCSILSLK